MGQKFPDAVKPVPQCLVILRTEQQTDQKIRENETMKPKARFIKSVITAARENDTQMPWARGTNRASFSASRRACAPLLRVKTA
ncbi:MAG: hypothetical protein ACI8R4_003836 [Paracoccaceae bacterium]